MPTVLSDIDFTALPDSPAAPTPGAAGLVGQGYEDVDGGKWGILGGELVLYDGSRPEGKLLRHAGETLKDCRVEVFSTNWSTPILLVARYINDTTFQQIHFQSDNILVHGFDYLTTYPALPAGPYWFRADFRDNGDGSSTLYCAVLDPDGTTVVREATKTDLTSGPQGAGRAGLNCFYNFRPYITKLRITDLAAVAPLAPVTLGRGQPTRTQVFLTAPDNSTGTAPRTDLWRRQFSMEAPVDLGTDPVAQTDTPPDGRAYKYMLVTTDATRASVTSGPITAGRRSVRNLFLVDMGDSTTFGDISYTFNGLRDSPTSRMIPLLAGFGDRVWVDSSATLANKLGKSVVHNAGSSGWSTATFLSAYPDDPQGRSWLQVTLDDVARFRDEVDPDALIGVGVRLGANDLGANISTAIYKADQTDISNEITGRGWACLLHYPAPSIDGNRPVGHSAQHQAIDELIAAGVAQAGDRESHVVMARHYPDWYLPSGQGGFDTIHPGPLGWQAMASGAAAAWNRAVLNPVSTVPIPGPAVFRRFPVLRRGR